jgi:hypothetical protein
MKLFHFTKFLNEIKALMGQDIERKKKKKKKRRTKSPPPKRHKEGWGLKRWW